MKILAMDLSLNCPGFAVLEVTDRKITLVDKANVDNIKDSQKPSEKRKPTGRKLQEIARQIHHMIKTHKPDVVVRERGFSRHNGATQALFRVVGVADLIVFDAAQQPIYELAPTSVKLLVTGVGTSDKSKVCKDLEQYVGDHLYATQDESDAVAVGIAWAIQEHWIDQKITKETVKRIKAAAKGKKKKQQIKTKQSNWLYARKSGIRHGSRFVI